MLKRTRRSVLGSVAVGMYVGLGAGCAMSGGAPRFEVDPLWPTPLEYPYILGAVTGVFIDPQDHLLVVSRQDLFTPATEIGATLDPPGGDCCIPSPGVLEYDANGFLVRWWGGPGPGYVWPVRPHGIALDPQGNVWIGGSGSPDSVDSHILKFSRVGRLLQQIGQPGQAANSQSQTSFGGPARFSFDASANEVYVADGYTNRRVVVLDIASGAVKRFWGAYGNAPSDANPGPYNPSAPPAQQFRTVTCAELSNDRLVYVCDRGNNRLQVFRPDGTFVTERIIEPATLGQGSVWDVAFSRDPQQQYLYVADGMNERVYVYDRQSLELLTSFGTGGRYPSQFLAVGSLAVDSRGNVYTGENEQGKRVQKFIFRGTGPVRTLHQGTVWPTQ